MLVTYRQGIVRTENFVNFLVYTNGHVNLRIINEPVVISLADGDVDYLFIEQETIEKAWQGPFSSEESYWLYWDIDVSTGKRSFGSTKVEPQVGPTKPATATLDQHFFDTTTNEMYVWNLYEWVKKIRVFAGRLDKNNPIPEDLVSQIKIYREVFAGQIMFDQDDEPIIRNNGKFLTTESYVSPIDNPINVFKIEPRQVRAYSIEEIPAFHAVTWKGPNQVGVAKQTNPELGACVGISIENMLKDSRRRFVTKGYIVNEAWDFSDDDDAGKDLYVGENGEITLDFPRKTSFQKIGKVVNKNSIFVHIQQLVKLNGPIVTPTPTWSLSASVTPTPSVTASDAATPTPTPTATVTPTTSVTPSITPSVSLTPAITPSNSPTPSITASVTPTASPTVTPTNTATPTITASVTPVASITPTVTPTNTATPTVTATVTPTVTPSVTFSPTPTTTPPPSFFNLAGATYDSNKVYFPDAGVAAGFGATDLYMKPDGTKVYLAGANTSNRYIYEISLTTPWDLTSYSGVAFQNIQFQTPGFPMGSVSFFIKPDGTKIYVNETNTGVVTQWTMSTPWDLTTLSHDSVSFNTVHETLERALNFKPDGTKMYVGISVGAIRQYGLSTPWDLSTATYDSIRETPFLGGLQENGSRFNQGGTKIYTCGPSQIKQFSLSPAWDLSSITDDSILFDPVVVTGEWTIDFSPDYQYMFVLDLGGDTVYRFTG